MSETTKASKDDATIIKKYANRRLYNTGTSTYVTLEDLAEMVKKGDDFIVQDAKTRKDITHSVLTQIIFDQEAKGENLLPINFLRQIIRFYGDSMQALVPSYLNSTMESFADNKSVFQECLNGSIGGAAIGAVDDLVKRNAQIFDQTMRMFSPFPAGGNEAPETENTSSGDGDMDDVKRKLAEMEKRLEALSKSSET